MRLKEEEKDKIVLYAKKHFGNRIKLYLFGSRVYDNKKGGDIDLLIETEELIDMQTQIKFLAAIYKNITQRKIDLLIKTPESQDLPIYKTAKKEGVLLC